MQILAAIPHIKSHQWGKKQRKKKAKVKQNDQQPPEKHRKTVKKIHALRNPNKNVPVANSPIKQKEKLKTECNMMHKKPKNRNCATALQGGTAIRPPKMARTWVWELRLEEIRFNRQITARRPLSLYLIR